MPPATADSKSRSTPAVDAASNSSAPQLASSSLLAVTTGLPDLRASRIRVRAGSMPPMTSTTTSTLGIGDHRVGVGGQDAVGRPGRRVPGTGCAPPRRPARGAGRCGPRSGRRRRRAAGPALRRRGRSRADPTRSDVASMLQRVVAAWPGERGSPRWAAGSGGYSVEGQQVVERLPADDDPARAVPDEHDRRPRHLVVGRRHRVAVGAGHRRGQHVADGDIGRQPGVPHDHVAGLAVLADDGDRPGPPGVGRPHQERLVAAAVQAPAGGCRSCRRRR